MRNTRTHHLRRALATACALVITLLPLITSAPSDASAEEKMRAEDVVAKHLESIASSEARASVTSRVIAGSSRAVFKARNSAGAIDGLVVMASQNNKVLFGMAFPNPEYPSDKFGFDGKKFTVGYLKPGIRSILGSFILSHGEVFKEGLMGGALSSAWPLLNLSERKAKLEYSGTDKIGEQLVHKLKYNPSKGSDLDITLFFDARTFHHVRTQYSRISGARLSAGGIDSQSSQRAMRHKLTEDFSDFKQEGELTLPHSYKLQLEIESTNGNSAHKWEIILNQFAFNETLDDSGFNVEAN